MRGTMCLRLSHRCLLVFNLLLLSYSVGAEELPFDAVISFGDSNTDAGNVYRLTHHSWPLIPPQYQGRFSDGSVSIERLGVSNLLNYACGGATSDNDFAQGYTASGTVPVPGARQQIQLYLRTIPQHRRESKHTLHMVWIVCVERVTESPPRTNCGPQPSSLEGTDPTELSPSRSHQVYRSRRSAVGISPMVK